MRYITVTAVALTVGSLLLAACGSSSPNRDDQFVARANAICARAQKKAQPLASGGKLDPARLGQAVALLTKTGEELKAITPPPQLRVGYSRFLALAKGEVAAVTRLAQYVRDRNLAGFRAAKAQLNSGATNEQAASLGLKVCAEEKG